MTEPTPTKARFITPPNLLKQKVGSGGLSKDILERAQKLLEHNNIEFHPIAYTYMEFLYAGIENAYNPPEDSNEEDLLENLVSPIMQLKGNGGMFHYPLVTKISAKMVLFLESLKGIDNDVLEITQAYYTTITAILQSNLKGDGGVEGDSLYQAICDACDRYSKKHPD